MRLKSLLSLISIPLSFALVLSVLSPARGYELSLYTATPVEIWICLGLVGLIASIALVFGTRQQQFIGSGSLAAISLTIFWLPIFRSYYYLGTGDSMTYLGEARDIVITGSIKEIIYPALSIIAATLHIVGKIPVERAWLLTVAWLAVLFVIGVAITVRVISPSPAATLLAILSGALFLPLNQVTRAGVFSAPSTTTGAIFFVSILLFVFLRSLLSFDQRWTLILGILLLGLLLIHPQQLINVITTVLVITTAQMIMTSSSKVGRIQFPRYSSLSIAIGAVLWLWVTGFDPFNNTVRAIVVGVFLAGTSGDVSDAGLSLTAIGASVEELFIKIFLTGFIMCVFVGIAMFVSILPDHRIPSRLMAFKMRQIEFVLSTAIIPLTFITGVYALALSQYFRHIGFIMVIVSILSPIIIMRLSQSFSFPFRRVAAIGGTILVIITFSMSAAIIYPSPYIYQDTGHVTESEVTGYHHMFERTPESAEISHLRMHPLRFHDAIYGTGSSQSATTEQVLYEFSRALEEDNGQRYYAVSIADRKIEFELYNGVFLNESELINLQRGTDRIYNSGGFSLYYS